jgi:hypothetical protein
MRNSCQQVWDLCGRFHQIQFQARLLEIGSRPVGMLLLWHPAFTVSTCSACLTHYKVSWNKHVVVLPRTQMARAMRSTSLTVLHALVSRRRTISPWMRSTSGIKRLGGQYLVPKIVPHYSLYSRHQMDRMRRSSARYAPLRVYRYTPTSKNKQLYVPSSHINT